VAPTGFEPVFQP